MQIPRPSEEDRQFLRTIVPADERVVVRPMFGNLGAFVHGNMFAGLFGAAVGVRLPDADRAELALVDGAGPYGPPERPIGGYLSLPAAWRDEPDLARAWVERAFLAAATLPPKEPRKRAVRGSRP